MDKLNSSVTGTLKDWVYDKFCNCVWGYIEGDVRDRFTDGTWIHTSDIPSTRQTRSFTAKEGDLIYTRNSIYRLGKPRKEIEDEY